MPSSLAKIKFLRWPWIVKVTTHFLNPNMAGGSQLADDNEEKHAGYWWLLFCVVGMVSSLTLYGLVLEFVTSGGRKLHEISFVFVTTAIYAITAFVAREIFNEKPTHISKYQMLILSMTSIASTFTSVRSLRYVIYPVQVRRHHYAARNSFVCLSTTYAKWIFTWTIT